MLDRVISEFDDMCLTKTGPPAVFFMLIYMFVFLAVLPLLHILDVMLCSLEEE